MVEPTPGRKVNLVVPKRGEKKQLVEMVGKNAVAALEARFAKILGQGGYCSLL